LWKKTKKRIEDLFVNSAASIIVSLVFFVGGFIAVLYFMARFRMSFGPSIFVALPVVAVIAVGIGLVGPIVYRKERDRGRGSLKDVREQTRAQEAGRCRNIR
jgi:hypothetical protein